VAAKEADARFSGKEPIDDALDVPESPRRMRTTERFQKIKLAAEKRWERLRNNREWVWETYRLKFQLKPFVQNNPDQVKRFFVPTFIQIDLWPDSRILHASGPWPATPVALLSEAETFPWVVLESSRGASGAVIASPISC
jgi:hypothetical protein